MKATQKGARKVLALAIVIVMVLGLVPFSALAKEEAGTLDDYSFISNADPAVTAQLLLEGRTDEEGPISPGEVRTARSVVNNPDGTFSVTLLAVGASYDVEVVDEDDSIITVTKTPLKSDMVFTYDVNDGFKISNPVGVTASEQTITWTIAAEDLKDSTVLTATYTLTLEGRETDHPYYTHPDTDVTFTVKDDNPYYWTNRRVDTDVYYGARINWNNNNQGGTGSNNTSEVVWVELDIGTSRIDGKTDWMTKSDFDQLALKDYPTKNFFTSVVEGQGDDKEYTFWFVIYKSPGVYEIYDNVGRPVGNNGGNTTYPQFLQKTIVTLIPIPQNGNDGEGNVTHKITNKGWIELTALEPAISVKKEVVKEKAFYTAGDRVVYRVTVTNSGETAEVKGVAISDPSAEGPYLTARDARRGVNLLAEDDIVTTVTNKLVYYYAKTIKTADYGMNNQTFVNTVTVSADGCKDDNDSAKVNIRGKLTVEKIWDASVPAGMEHAITFTLYKDGVALPGTHTLSAPNWSKTFVGLEIGAVYCVEEEGIALNIDFTADPGDEATINSTTPRPTITITNSYKEPTGTVVIEKIWDDDLNIGGDRPGSLTVYLNGNQYTLTGEKAAEKWSMELSGLSLGEYSLTEETISNKDYSQNTADSRSVLSGTLVRDQAQPLTLTLVNTYVPPVYKINITKIWEDGTVNGASRPDSIDVNVTTEDGYDGTVTLSGNTDTWGPVTLEVPGEGTYLIEEVVIGDYDVDYSIKDRTIVLEKDGNREGYIKITNSDAAPEGTITVTKIWVDDGFTDLRPASITVNLMKNDVLEDSATLPNENGEWKYTFEGLSLDDGAVYTVEEVINGATLDYDFDAGTPVTLGRGASARNQGIVITNSYTDGALTVVKTWSPGTDPRQPSEEITVTLEAYEYIVVGTHQEYDEENDAYIDVVDYDWAWVEQASKTFTGSWTFYNLELNKEYRIREEGVPANYTAEGERAVQLSDENKNPTLYLENKYNEPTGLLTVKKAWDGPVDPSRNSVVINVTLFRNDAPYGEPITLDSSNGWSKDIEIPSSDFGTFRIEENSVPTNYTLVGYSDPVFIGYGATKADDKLIGTLTVTNEYKIPTGNIVVEKKWHDAQYDYNQPGEITVILYSQVNNHRWVPTGETRTLDADGSWQNVFENLPIHDKNGNTITYRVVENPVPDDYSVTYRHNRVTLTAGATRTATVINSVTVPTGSIIVEKIWEPGHSDYEYDSVKVQLVIDGVASTAETHTLELNKENGFKSSFDGLDIYNSERKPIEYTIIEVEEIENENWKPKYSVDGVNFKDLKDFESVSFDNDNRDAQSITILNEWKDFVPGIIIDKDSDRNSNILAGEGDEKEAEFIFTLTVTNDSNKGIDKVLVTDILPEGAIIVESYLESLIWVYNYDKEKNTITFEIPSMDVDEVIEIEYKVIFKEAGGYTNTAFATAFHPEANNGFGSEESSKTVVVKDTGLVILKSNTNTGSIELVNGWATLSYKLEVKNNGGVDFETLVVTDTLSLPEGASFEFIDSNYEDVLQIDGNVLTFTFENGLAVGDEITITYSVKVDKIGDYDNNAVVIGSYTFEDEVRTLKDEDNADITVTFTPPTPPPPPPPPPPSTDTRDPDPDPVDIDDPDPEPDPDLADLEDTDPPLAALPPEPEEDIIDPDVPLGTLPQTGLQQILPLGVLGLGAGALAGGILLGKKKDEDIV